MKPKILCPKCQEYYRLGHFKRTFNFDKKTKKWKLVKEEPLCENASINVNVYMGDNGRGCSYIEEIIQ